MDEKIKPKQYMFLIAGFITGSILLIAFLVAAHDSWIAAITGLIVIIPIIFLYVCLFRRFDGKNLIEIHDIVYGKVLGKIVSLLYIFFFLTLTSLNTRDVSVFFTGYFMSETPMIFFMLMFIACCAYAVKKGILVIAKVSFILTLFVYIVIFLLFFMLLDKMDFSNFLPVFESPAKEMYQSTQTMSMVTYGEIIAFLMIMPFVTEKNKLGRYSIGGISLAALTFLALVVRNTAVLGPSAMIYQQPSFETVRLINIGDFFNRIEIIIALNNTSMMFIKTSILLYCTVKSIAQVMKLRTHTPILIPVGVIAVIYAMVAFASEAVHHHWGRHYASFFEIPFVLILPVLTFLIACIRKLKAPSAGAPANSGETTPEIPK